VVHQSKWAARKNETRCERRFLRRVEVGQEIATPNRAAVFSSKAFEADSTGRRTPGSHKRGYRGATPSWR